MDFDDELYIAITNPKQYRVRNMLREMTKNIFVYV
jgi:hypothetical protein